MQGVLSQAMVMGASSLAKVEILAPPNGSLPGDRIAFDASPWRAWQEAEP
jgi:aminoacyl tRNA synthase complex-interacting multifunctional protein 1